jgi:hypothetical protein
MLVTPVRDPVAMLVIAHLREQIAPMAGNVP